MFPHSCVLNDAELISFVVDLIMYMLFAAGSVGSCSERYCEFICHDIQNAALRCAVLRCTVF